MSEGMTRTRVTRGEVEMELQGLRREFAAGINDYHTEVLRPWVNAVIQESARYQPLWRRVVRFFRLKRASFKAKARMRKYAGRRLTGEKPVDQPVAPKELVKMKARRHGRPHLVEKGNRGTICGLVGNPRFEVDDNARICIQCKRGLFRTGVLNGDRQRRRERSDAQV